MITGLIPGAVWWTGASTSGAGSSPAVTQGAAAASRSGRWGVYIDTETYAPLIRDGRVVVCSEALSMVEHALLTEFGSVADLPDFGAGILTEVTHISDTTLRDLERRADRALQQLVDGRILYSYDRECVWNTDGYPQIEVSFSSPAGYETSTFPLWR